jgi:hypothetical protein
VWLLALLAGAGLSADGAADARYLGSQACAGCHARIARTFARTGMGRSLRAAEIPAGAPETATVNHSKVERTLRVWRENSRLYQSEAQPGVFETRHRLEYVVGSGANGYSFLVRRGDHLFQAPLSYYPQVGKWDLSPGYESGDYAFSRPVAESCIVCHSGRARAVEGQNGRYESSPFAELAIGCENCHGPGSRHAAEASRGVRRPGAIVNPAKLEPRLAEQICMFCHQGGDTRVLQPGKRYRDFRPGTWLDQTLAIGNLPATEREADLLEHHKAMAASRCFRASQGKLSCLTCHDPHVEPAAAERAAYYRSRCFACHTAKSCAAAPQARQARADDCTACHMPRRQDPQISHAALTNHRIVRRPEERLPAREEAAGVELVHVNPAPGGKPLSEITLLRMYGELLDRDPGLGARYLALLEKLIRTEPENPLVLAALGRKEAREKNPAADREAARHLRRAMELGFQGPAAFEDLAEVLARAGKAEEAVAVLERGIALEPFAPVLQKGLILRLIGLQRYDRARAAMEHYVETFPEDSFMRGLLAQVSGRP